MTADTHVQLRGSTSVSIILIQSIEQTDTNKFITKSPSCTIHQIFMKVIIIENLRAGDQLVHGLLD